MHQQNGREPHRASTNKAKNLTKYSRTNGSHKLATFTFQDYFNAHVRQGSRGCTSTNSQDVVQLWQDQERRGEGEGGNSVLSGRGHKVSKRNAVLFRLGTVALDSRVSTAPLQAGTYCLIKPKGPQTPEMT